MKIEIGSRAFFKNFPDYVEKDRDYLVLIDKELIPGKLIINMKRQGDDVFFMWNAGKDTVIRRHTESNYAPMTWGKFLVPEVIRTLGITVEDLEKMKDIFSKMDDKHSYEKTIYDFYIENEKPELTEEQLEIAYREYKEKRPDIYEAGRK